MRLYLDDLRHAPPSWTPARTFDEGLLRAHRGQWEAMGLGDTYLKNLGNTLVSGVDVKKGGA